MSVETADWQFWLRLPKAPFARPVAFEDADCAEVSDAEKASAAVADRALRANMAVGIRYAGIGRRQSPGRRCLAQERRCGSSAAPATKVTRFGREAVQQGPRERNSAKLAAYCSRYKRL